MKSTPGPWKVYNASLSPGSQTGRLAITGDEEPMVMRNIATIEGGPREKLLANANLIAAAPELLSALEVAESWIDENREHEHTGEGHQAMAVLEGIRFAIAKAKGGKQQ